MWDAPFTYSHQYPYFVNAPIKNSVRHPNYWTHSDVSSGLDFSQSNRTKLTD